MANAQELVQYCEKLRTDYHEKLIDVLNLYFELRFIKKHKPFRALIGNKRCKPIPIYKDFENGQFSWPNFSEEKLRSELENLGFVIMKGNISFLENKIYIVVPVPEKGQELTFAQKCVVKINTSYSKFCSQEKRRAEKLYNDFISALQSTPQKRIEIYDDFTLFINFKFKPQMSKQCCKFFARLMARDGISEYIINGTYLGIKVLRQLPTE